MTAHDHAEIVPGCFRCELGADEMNPAFDWPRPTRTTRLDAIAARLEAATKGPWEAVLNFSAVSVRALDPYARLGFHLVAQVPRRYVTLSHEFIGVAGHPDDDECTHRADGTDATYCGQTRAEHDPRRSGDADLIAHAPADLAALLAVVREVAALHQPEEQNYSGMGRPACGCGALRVMTRPNGEKALVPETHPCPTAKALAPLTQGETDGR